MAIGFYFDMERCTGCRACQVACKDKNDLDVGTIFRHARSYTVGAFPDVVGYSYSATCNHCEAPACITACPAGAIYKAEDGAVIIDQNVCVGEQDCVKACPYGVPQVMPNGHANKCDSCYAIRMEGANPVCVDACPSRALDFGEVEELKSLYGEDLVSEIAVLPSSSTSPNVYIKAKAAAKEKSYNTVNW